MNDPTPDAPTAAPDPDPDAVPAAETTGVQSASGEEAAPEPQAASDAEPQAASDAEPASDTEPAAEPEPEPDPEPEPPREPTEAELRAEALFARIEAVLGDNIVEHAVNFDDLVVRVKPEVWGRVAEVAHDTLGCDYLSFVAGIDWLPAPTPAGDDAGGDTSAPVQPKEMTFGVAGSAGRFQVFAAVQSTTQHHGVIFKTDVDEADPRVASWTPVYAGADWHERECWEMFGINFDGHPAMRRLYLPSGFEGNPLRKEFPLLAREVKPWPGLVDVEPMPGEDPGEADEGGGG